MVSLVRFVMSGAGTYDFEIIIPLNMLMYHSFFN